MNTHRVRNDLLTGAIRVHLANGENTSARQFCQPTTFSFGLTVLAITVSIIVGGGPQKQVGNIDASAIVAVMADAHSSGNGTMRQFVGKAMRLLEFGANGIECAVPVFIAVSGPFPALTGSTFGDLAPKAFDGSHAPHFMPVGHGLNLRHTPLAVNYIMS